MKIAVTSRSFSANKDLTSSLLEKYSDVKLNTEGLSLAGEELYEYLKDADAAIIALEKVDKNILDRLPNLKIISKYGVGLDNLDLAAMKEKGIKLGWASGANKRSVAELTLCFAIGMIRDVFSSYEFVKNGGWKQFLGNQLTDKTYGIVGLGNVGQDLVKLLKPFNCRIIACDILDRSDFCKEHNVEQVDMKTVFSQSDVVSIHVPCQSDTINLINKDSFALMKQTAILINTARGRIVNEDDLYSVLIEKKIAGAAFDVLAEEPPKNNPLISLENFYITPHIGGSAKEAVLAMGMGAINGLENFVEY